MPDPTRPARSSLGDRVFQLLSQSAGVFVLSVAAALVAILVYQSWPALREIGPVRMLSSSDWEPDGEPEAYGTLLFVYGTVATTVIAMLVAVPLGVGTAAYLSEIASPRTRRVSGFLLELLAAIPSVIYGFWALEFLAKRGVGPAYDLFGIKHTSGLGILTAGLVLAVMILPYITAVSYDVCQAVPRSQREGSLALGATRWQTIWRVVLPYARPGIIAACFLAMGLAVGETMAVTMVIGGGQHLHLLPNATGDTIPSIIAKRLHETTPGDVLQRSTLIALALLLLVITLLTNVVARVLIRWVSRPRARGGRRPVTLHDGAEPPPPTAEEGAAARRRARRRDRLMTGVLRGCQVFTVAPLFLILGYITYKGASEVNWALLTNMPRSEPHGIRNALVGSGILVGLASAFAIPVGLLAAVLLSEYRNSRLAAPVRFVAELLGGVPSIVVGVFVYALLVFPFWLAPGQKAWGYSGWAGAAALGVMMLPVVIRAAEEAMRLVPGSLREASYALGASRRQTVLKVVIPAALPAILTGVLLAVGRIAGETAPLVLTAGGSQLMPHSPSDRMPSLPYYVYYYAGRSRDDEVRLAWATAFVLVALVLMLNVSVRLLAGNRTVSAARAD